MSALNEEKRKHIYIYYIFLWYIQRSVTKELRKFYIYIYILFFLNIPQIPFIDSLRCTTFFLYLCFFFSILCKGVFISHNYLFPPHFLRPIPRSNYISFWLTHPFSSYRIRLRSHLFLRVSLTWHA